MSAANGNGSSWVDEAACGPETAHVFYPETSSDTGVSTGRSQILEAEAKRICRTCPVRDACLQDALQTGERYGVRGGLNPAERDAIIRRDRRSARRRV